MQLRSREDLIKEESDRRAFRYLLATLAWLCADDSPWARLDNEEDVPAKEALADFWRLEMKVERLTDEHEKRDANPEVLARFKAYIERQVKLEALAAQADRLARAAVRAGLNYSASQTMFVRALDRLNEADPKAFPPEGW